jgi:hypothetical protein
LATATGWLRAKFGLDALEKRQLRACVRTPAKAEGKGCPIGECHR